MDNQDNYRQPAQNQHRHRRPDQDQHDYQQPHQGEGESSIPNPSVDIDVLYDLVNAEAAHHSDQYMRYVTPTFFQPQPAAYSSHHSSTDVWGLPALGSSSQPPQGLDSFGYPQSSLSDPGVYRQTDIENLFDEVHGDEQWQASNSYAQPPQQDAQHTAASRGKSRTHSSHHSRRNLPQSSKFSGQNHPQQQELGSLANNHD